MTRSTRDMARRKALPERAGLGAEAKLVVPVGGPAKTAVERCQGQRVEEHGCPGDHPQPQDRDGEYPGHLTVLEDHVFPQVDRAEDRAQTGQRLDIAVRPAGGTEPQ